MFRIASATGVMLLTVHHGLWKRRTSCPYGMMGLVLHACFGGAGGLRRVKCASESSRTGPLHCVVTNGSAQCEI